MSQVPSKRRELNANGMGRPVGRVLTDGDSPTSACEGCGACERRVNRTSAHQLSTKLLVNLESADQARKLSELPVDGVGLLRMDSIIEAIGVHPAAVCGSRARLGMSEQKEIEAILGGKDIRALFIQRLAQAIVEVAAWFFPRPIFIRTREGTRKKNGHLLGAPSQGPLELNPLLGLRGVARYLNEDYREEFLIECEAIRKAIDETAQANVKIIIPLCRTAVEGQQIIALLKANGLNSTSTGPAIYYGCDTPSSALDADGFLEVFDGLAIGSEDLVQLTLAVDHQAPSIADPYDDRDFAVMQLMVMAINSAHSVGKPVLFFRNGQFADSGYIPWLVRQGVESISVDAGEVLNTLEVITRAEATTRAGLKVVT